MESFDTFWDQARPAFGQERTWGRARTLALSALVGLGRTEGKTNGHQIADALPSAVCYAFR
jgi:hypothetical protein